MKNLLHLRMDFIFGTKSPLGPDIVSKVEGQAGKCCLGLKLTCDCKVMRVLSGLAHKIIKDSDLLKTKNNLRVSSF